MTSERWERLRLGDFVTLQRGHDLPAPRRRPGTVPVLGSFGVTGYHDTLRARGPGVTVGRSGASFGVVSYSAVDYWPLNTALYVVDFHGNDPRFAYYLLKFIDFRRYDSGTAQPSLNRNYIHPIPIEVPPVQEQRAIARILGSLDDKIELNRRMNETLEDIARAIFKSWFVDFDPVRAKTEDRQPLGMDAETAALLPDSFEDSPLGKIPAGWRIGLIRELVELSRDALNPTSLPTEEFDHYSIPAFDEGRMPKIETGEQIKSNKLLVPSGSVLLSKLNPRFPRVWLPASDGAPRSICSTEFLVALPKRPATREYLYSVFVSGPFLDRFATLATGTSGSHQRVKANDLLSMNVVIPSARVIPQFTDITGPLFVRLQANLNESRTLASIRDTLLPKLISGEMRTAPALCE